MPVDADTAVTADRSCDPEAVVAAALADLAENEPPQEVLERLRALDGRIQGALRARWLRAKAIAANRLGFPGEALGDLMEALQVLAGEDAPRERAEIFHAIAVVHSWRGDAREAALALLATVGESASADDRTGVALALIEAGRLQMEIGRPGESQALIARGLKLGAELPVRELQRANVNLVQALVAAKQIGEADRALAAATELLADASARLMLLAGIARARIALAGGDIAGARAALAKAAAHVPAQEEDPFERVEVAHAEAEISLAEAEPAQAVAALEAVISRYATDDLPGREVEARLLHAKAFDALGRIEEADRTLIAALRRALANGLSGHVDAVRSRLAERSGSDDASIPAEMASVGPIPDAGRRFVRRRPLGAGGFGSVVRAYDLELGIEVALKRTSLTGVYDPATRRRLLDAARTEIAAAAKIGHPGVAKIYGLLVEGDHHALLIEEFVEGPTLRAAMAKPIEPVRALDILARIAFALAAIHPAGVVHCDLKPENIILRGDGSPVLVDFGIARIVGEPRRVKGGTPTYMAPEQARGRKVDRRADLYALGTLAHELLVGQRPERWDGPLSILRFSPSAEIRSDLLASGCGEGVADMIVSMLAPHPFWRPGSAAAVGACFADAATVAAQAAVAARTQEGGATHP
jgi:tetratricopeptide (TPR) repeat protein